MRFNRSFFLRDALAVAPDLLGAFLVVQNATGNSSKFMITEVEAYRGETDLACHASKGRTKRTEVMYADGGHIYIYLIYGMHWMLNIVTEKEGVPQAVLIRGVNDCSGPGRLTKLMGVDKSFNGDDVIHSKRLWIESSKIKPAYKTGPRIGVQYAGDYWANLPWRFWIEEPHLYP